MNDEELRAVAAIERAVVGRVIHDPSILDAMPVLERDDFADPKAEAMWTAVMNLVGESRRVEPMALDAELARIGRLEMLGGLGASMLWMLDGMGLHEESCVRHACDIQQRGLAKRVVMRLSDVLGRVRREDMGGEEALSEVQAVLNRLAQSSTSDATVSIGDAVSRRVAHLESLEERRRNGEKVLTGLPTGVERLDSRIGGWQVGIVQLLCGRPAMGKSSVLLSTVDACSAAGVGVHVFTLEDSLDAHSDRAMSRQSSVPASNIRSLRLDQTQFVSLAKAQGDLRSRRGWIVDESAGITAKEIVRRARKHARKNGTKLVAVDYVNLVKSSGRARNEHEALTEVITEFAVSAKNDGFAYLVLAQLNRGLEARNDKRPMMSDLRESGSLEERAKLIVSVYRGSYYSGRPTKGIDWDPEAPLHGSMPRTEPTQEQYAATVQLGVIKNNGGPTGTIFASWDGPTTRVW